MNRYMLFWIPAVILVPILYVYLWPHLPYLTPSQINVIDTRSFIIHFLVAVGVSIFLSYIAVEKMIRGSYLFYSGMMLFVAILSLLALSENHVFYFNYPFSNPSSISFPFPNQNMAAPFISICVVGMMGAAEIYKKKSGVVLVIPVGVMAAALTGSRSNMVVLLMALAGYAGMYAFGWVGGRESWKWDKGIGILGPVVSIGMAVGGLALIYDWQPVRRSLSVLGMIAGDPVGLLLGGPEGSPRREMWRTALYSERPKQGESKDEKYKIYILLVENGRIERARAITNLRVGQRYYVRLRVGRPAGGSGVSLLEVFSGPNHDRPVGRSRLAVGSMPVKNLFLFVSDTGRKRGLVTMSGSLDNYRVHARNMDEWRFAFAKDERLSWYEEWYEEKYGDSKGVIRSDHERLEWMAYDQAVRAYVNKPGLLDGTEAAYTLEYEVLVSHLDRVVSPLTSPELFYVGFHDGNPASSDRAWEELSNALFVAHERMLSEYEESILLQQRVLRFSKMRDQGTFAGGLAELIRGKKEESDGKDRQATVRVEMLWEPALTKDEIKQANRYQSGAWIDDEGSNSVKPDKSWSSEGYLSRKGSTHNVYLDWYYYVGRIPFALFLAFIALLLQAFSVFSWRQRKSEWAPFYLATWFQTVIIVLSMYAHPGVWVKYIWVLFGVAGGIMLSEEGRRPRLQRDSLSIT